ncbi:MAG: Gfo/Idh/MocA family oxidoreductase [Candidatus Omnitrophica bacterium]|nr:Gfo/Idh/MocA family oxidoreductase [Candidatus Omnitrophota bacterium]
MSDIKIGVIGVGYLGSVHARIYSQIQGVQLVGVCDTDEVKARAVARQFHTTPFKEFSDLIGKVDAVSVVVPTNLHHVVAKPLLENGIHLLVEKPITTTLKEADDLLTVAKNKNLILQVGHVERFNAGFLAVEKIINKPIFIECHRLGPFKKRATDVGVILDLMIHDIDIILGLIKQKIKSIEAVGAPVLTEREDIANVRLQFENNSVCNLTASRITDKTMRKIRIFQRDAYISLDYFKPSCFIYRKEGPKITRQSVKIRKEEPLKLELESFVNCVRSKERPLVSGLEGRQALAIALEIEKKIKDFSNAL